MFSFFTRNNYLGLKLSYQAVNAGLLIYNLYTYLTDSNQSSNLDLLSSILSPALSVLAARKDNSLWQIAATLASIPGILNIELTSFINGTIYGSTILTRALNEELGIGRINQPLPVAFDDNLSDFTKAAAAA